jgi:hypothetical protein
MIWKNATSFHGFDAQVGDVTYRLDDGCGGYGGVAAFLIARGPRGGQMRRNLGNFKTIAQAKACCEQHYADGCDMAGVWRL